MGGGAFSLASGLFGSGGRGPDRRARRLLVLGTAAGLASGVGVHRRRAHAASANAKSRMSSKSSTGAAGPGAFTHAMAGAFAGGVSRVAVAPLDVIKIRMQVQVEPVAAAANVDPGKYRGIVQCATTILREEGVRGLWAGTVPALFLWVPYTAVQFAALGEFRRRCAAADLDAAKPPLAFVGGAVAGASATVCTYPFDVMRTVLAAQGSPRVYDSLAEAARGIVRDRGVRGLYAGVGVTLVEIIPASAIQFGTYALFKAAALRAEGEEEDGQLSPGGNAACGFASGCVARLVIHPLDVVKKRFQVAGLARSLRYGERVTAAEFSTLGGAFRAIAAKEGVRGFYKGLAPGLVKSAPASAITFAAYEFAMRAVAARDAGGGGHRAQHAGRGA